MNANDHERITQLLKKSMPPIAPGDSAGPRRDLWQAMLARLEARRAVPVPWFDWALLAAVSALLVFFPGAIAVLLYHL